jgi:hypothetical protein
MERCTGVAITILLMSFSSAAHAACGSKPPAPASMAGFANWVERLEAWVNCVNSEQMERFWQNPTANGGMAGKARIDEETTARYDQFLEEIGQVQRRLESGQGAGSASGSNAAARRPASGGVDCAALEREATSRLYDIQARSERARGMCEQYQLAEEMGEIGVEMYGNCPILDPAGTQLAAAQQMIEDARQGQRGVCTR